jgi:hypothetical protein
MIIRSFKFKLFRKARAPNNKFVIGFGASVGLGLNATLIDFNLNGGTTLNSTPWKK